MSVPQSIQRLSEDADTSPEVRQLLRASELDGPSEADLAKFAARMAPLVGLPLADLTPSLPHGTAPADVSGASWGGAAAKTGLAKWGSSLALKAVVAGTLSLGLGLWWANRPAPAPVHEPAQAPSVSVASRVAPVPVAPETNLPTSGGVAEQALPAPEAAPSAAKRVGASAPRPDELSLIAQAQSLRAEPQAVLRVLKQHATLYPQGMLAQEREVLAVEALVSAGQLKEAKRRAGRLEAEYPNSAHLPRIRALLDQADHE
ncbi:MAG: hypothetical protein QM778_35685 [Myxococcales bacterium]